jgi:leucine dehydrogenase
MIPAQQTLDSTDMLTETKPRPAPTKSTGDVAAGARADAGTIFSNADFDNHEGVHAFFDAPSGLKGFVAVHSTALGPAFGGCRMWPYKTEAEALRDALRLSQGMSYKNALAGIPYGGGKAVIIGDPRRDKSDAMFEAYGRVIDGLGGQYLTAEDVGINVEDMQIVGRRTRYVSGIAKEGRMAGGDPSPITAFGVFQGLRAAVHSALGRDTLEGLRVAVQGIGNVGYNLCKHLHEAGATLKVADVYQPNLDRAQADFDAEVIAPDAILFQDVDVLAPCALGAVLNEATIPRITAVVVAGAANNQLALESDGERLMARGILYAPDYVINSGGIIAVASEYEGGRPESDIRAQAERIYERTLAIFERANAEGKPPGDIADDMAREVIAGAKRH